MSDKKEIKRLRKYAKPYMKEVQDLFEGDQRNPLESAINFIEQNEPRSAINQCDRIAKQLLYKHYSIEANKMSFNKSIKAINDEFKQKDPLTCVQIQHIFHSSSNIECNDFTTAIFTLKNLIQILEIFKPDIQPKMDIDIELKYMQKKLSEVFFRKPDGEKFSYQKSTDKLFVDTKETPLKDALDFSPKKEHPNYKKCVADTRIILEKLIPFMYKKTTGIDYKGQAESQLYSILSDEQFKSINIRHYHTFDSLRVVGNWGHHPKEFPINNRYALFSLYSLYIFLRWFFDINYSEVFSKQKQYMSIACVATILSIFIYSLYPGHNYIQYLKNGDCEKAIQTISKITVPGINDRLWCSVCKVISCPDYFSYIATNEHQEAIQVLNNVCCRNNKDQFWLDFCLLKTGNPNSEYFQKRIDYFKIMDNKEYKRIYLFFKFVSQIKGAQHNGALNKDMEKFVDFFNHYFPKNNDPITFHNHLKIFYNERNK